MFPFLSVIIYRRYKPYGFERYVYIRNIKTFVGQITIKARNSVSKKMNEAYDQKPSDDDGNELNMGGKSLLNTYPGRKGSRGVH